MIVSENHCCDCATPNYPCRGNSCPYLEMIVYYCDTCNDNTCAKYEIDGKHCCEYHAKEYIKDYFDDLTLSEQADVLNISLKSLEEEYE